MFDFHLQILQKCKVYSKVNHETLYCSKSGKFQTLKKWNLKFLDEIGPNCKYLLTRDAQRSLFSSKSPTFGHGQTIWTNKFWGIWGIFGQFISTHFGIVSPLSMFSINQALFLQKTSLCIQIQTIDLGFGLEFGLQRIRNSTVMCP